MEIDIPKRKIRDSIEAIRDLERMDFPDLDSNTLDQLLANISILSELEASLTAEIDF
jgi:hypothetical protein